MRVSLEADLEGSLLRRYQRFFADVALADGRVLTVHCPNPGSMLGCATPGARVRCSTSESPTRKLAHTLEMIRVGRAWVGLHTTRANQLVAAALAARRLPFLEGYATVRREAAAGDGARLDFRLDDHASDPRPAWVEVKSVTLAAGRLARFPDSVTERGRRHLETLAKLRARGERALLLFVVQRADCDRVEPADDLDPAYGRALRAAAAGGVELRAIRARVSPRALALEGELPVLL
ncbi:MAG TPA: DNA/RNA nuclease SfsA [Myxococcota bacterium]|nr:DNA/RNA nuclease SfsA [Myxococcota bacterium]